MPPLAGSLILVDLAMLALAVWVAALLTAHTPRQVLVFVPLALGVLLARRSYRAVLYRTALDSTYVAVKAVTVATMATFTVVAVFGGEPTGWKHAALVLWAAALVTVPAGRVALVLASRVNRRRGRRLAPVIIVGTGDVAQQVARRLIEHPDYGLKPAGFLDADPFPLVAADGELPPYLGGPTSLAEALDATGACHVIIAFSTLSDDGLMQLLRRCQGLGVDVSVIPRFADAMHHRVALEHIGALPVLRVPGADPRNWQFAIKHAFDRSVAGLGLLLISPLFGTLALGVRLGSPGPVFFRQRRIGRDGCEFDLLKFRSMAPAPAGTEFTPDSGSAPGGVEGVDRRTRLGKFLRRSSLDELPQLLNVLRGEMSLIGPRPERPEYVELFDREVRRYAERHRVRSGMTGWAQVHGLRGQTSIAKRVEWDNYYIENFSLWLDIKIILLTMLAVFRPVEGEK